MQKKDERRVFERFDHDAPIVYAYHDTDQFFQAIMCNYSQGGMCFTTPDEVSPSSDIYIIMENFSLDGNQPELYESYFAEVRWCCQLSTLVTSGFKVGVKYYKTVID